MGMRSKLVGRERECQELHRVMESDRSEFVIVYGRRRVGKTFLVDQYYQVAKTEHSHPLGMVVSTHFRCGKGVKRGLKNGALPFNID